MTSTSFPLETCALHPDWPQARFNVSGMFVHHPLVVQLLKMAHHGFNCPLPIEAIHGAPAVPWNAGRLSKARFNPTEFREVLDFLYARNVGYFPTFTNHRISDTDLADPVCNTLLEHISQRPDLNAVIVNSDRLSQYIAQKYPSLRQVASIIKVTFENGRGRPDYYRQLGDRFYRYVVHPDDCRDLKLLDQLDRGKAEIIVNENCVANCPTRAHHYDLYAQLQTAVGTPDEPRVRQQLDDVVANCQSPLHLNNFGKYRRSCNLTPSEMKAIYDMGFRHFKLQGRADDPYAYAYDLTRFLLEPQCAAPLVYKSVCRWLSRVIVRHNQ